MKVFSSKKGQEVNKLYGFVLLIVLVGMVIGIGVLILDKFGTSVYYTGTDFNETLTPDNTSGVQLTWGYISSNDAALWDNGSAVPSSCYNVQQNGTFFTTVLINESCNYTGSQEWSISYDYRDYDTQTNVTAVAVHTEIGKIGSDWIGLIITVFILSIILWFVVRSFSPNQGR